MLLTYIEFDEFANYIQTYDSNEFGNHFRILNVRVQSAESDWTVLHFPLSRRKMVKMCGKRKFPEIQKFSGSL